MLSLLTHRSSSTSPYTILPSVHFSILQNSKDFSLSRCQTPKNDQHGPSLISNPQTCAGTVRHLSVFRDFKCGLESCRPAAFKCKSSLGFPNLHHTPTIQTNYMINMFTTQYRYNYSVGRMEKCLLISNASRRCLSRQTSVRLPDKSHSILCRFSVQRLAHTWQAGSILFHDSVM
ncbi:hypothetical protein PVAG01_03407 [Phlyctema vagabunda]|uniref:Uncharacterized protein n=1 Tax=Phlyctema vagabunda TaxID=108571 RepID=A0ABR4PLA2_9HELO